MPKFEVIHGGEESIPPEKKKENLRHELYELIDKYTCGIDAKPEWCVYGIGRDGGRGVLFWIRPSEESEFIAHRIAALETDLGGSATAEKTEHHPGFEGKPKYRGEEHENFVFGE